MMNSFALIMVCGVFIASVSQILLKKSARKNTGGGFLKEYLNRYVIIGYIMLVVSMFLAILAYRGMEYKYGAIVESLGYVFVMLLSYVFLKEKITKRKIIGNAIIIFGIIFFNLNIFPAL